MQMLATGCQTLQWKVQGNKGEAGLHLLLQSHQNPLWHRNRRKDLISRTFAILFPSSMSGCPFCPETLSEEHTITYTQRLLKEGS